jgi:hydroxymethylpyrimidine/phosphomethylpyrimidine kinase
MWLAQKTVREEALALIRKSVPVYTKNYSEADEHIKNVLSVCSSDIEFEVPKLQGYEKHGSGCVLSAAIAAGVARGMVLREAIMEAESYIARFLKSNTGLLGFHLQNEKQS